MNRILRKRLPRDLKEHLRRYLALILLIGLGVYLVLSIAGAAESIIHGTQNQREINQVEDGQFTVFSPLTDDEIHSISKEGTVIEPMFYSDIILFNQLKLRMFKNREKIDLIQLDTGRIARSKGEVVLEKRYAQEHNIQVDDTIDVNGVRLLVVGIGSVPDYDMPIANFSDSAVESWTFGLMFVTEAQYEDILKKSESNVEEYTYAYRLGKSVTDKELKEEIKKLGATHRKGQKTVSTVENLIQFIIAEENNRIASAAEDVAIDKSAGLLSGIVMMILFTYVISVFGIHQIERESSVIGAFYALGVKKNSLLCHYITMPTLVTLLGGVLGTSFACMPIGAKSQMVDTYNYFSLPQFDVIFPMYLIVYGILLPPIVAIVVNAFVLNKKLSRTALSLMKNEQKVSNYRTIRIKTNHFIKRFRIRQLIRESRSGVTILFGMLFSLMLVMLGLDIYVLCQSVKRDNVNDTKYEYMYVYKYPDKVVPNGGEEAFVKNFHIDCKGNKLDAMIIGISKDSQYFDAHTQIGTDKVVINNSMVERYGLKNGDNITLFDSANDTNYNFTVIDEVQYAPGFTVFMDIDSMRELFGKEDTYFNVVYSKEKLNIDADRLYSVISKEEIKKSSEQFINNMKPTIMMLLSIGVVIFCAVMYLMIGVMIDRSSYGISLMKIFGYRSKEVKKLYLDGNFIMIGVAGVISIPIAKQLIDSVYPYLITNVVCGMNLSFAWYFYILIYVMILFVYHIINYCMIRRIKKITPAELLKMRE